MRLLKCQRSRRIKRNHFTKSVNMPIDKPKTLPTSLKAILAFNFPKVIMCATPSLYLDFKYSKTRSLFLHRNQCQNLAWKFYRDLKIFQILNYILLDQDL